MTVPTRERSSHPAGTLTSCGGLCAGRPALAHSAWCLLSGRAAFSASAADILLTRSSDQGKQGLYLISNQVVGPAIATALRLRNPCATTLRSAESVEGVKKSRVDRDSPSLSAIKNRCILQSSAHSFLNRENTNDQANCRDQDHDQGVTDLYSVRGSDPGAGSVRQVSGKLATPFLAAQGVLRRPGRPSRCCGRPEARYASLRPSTQIEDLPTIGPTPRLVGMARRQASSTCSVLGRLAPSSGALREVQLSRGGAEPRPSVRRRCDQNAD